MIQIHSCTCFFFRQIFLIVFHLVSMCPIYYPTDCITSLCRYSAAAQSLCLKYAPPPTSCDKSGNQSRQECQIMIWKHFQSIICWAWNAGPHSFHLYHPFAFKTQLFPERKKISCSKHWLLRQYELWDLLFSAMTSRETEQLELG